MIYRSINNLSSLKDRTVLVTGAGGHIGKAICETIIDLNGNLILVDRQKKIVENFVDQIDHSQAENISIHECDLEKEIERKDFIKRINEEERQLHCLINNAAFVGDSNLNGWATNFSNQSLDAWRRAMEVNVTSIFHLAQGFHSLLDTAKGANIINIASIYGLLGPDWKLYENTNMSNPAAYSASKGALIQLTRWLATTLAPSIRVNSISPGGMIRKQPQEFIDRYSNKTPLARMGTEEDIKGAIAFLASDMSSYMTGQNICIDGGWGIW